MTKGAKKAAWIVGLIAGAVGIGGATYYFTRPKENVPPGTKPPAGGGGGGGVAPSGGTISPTVTPGVFAAFSPFSPNVSWVDQNGVPIGQGGGGGNATAFVPR